MKTKLLSPANVQAYYGLLFDYFKENLMPPYNTEDHALRMINGAIAGRFQVFAMLRENEDPEAQPYLLGFASTVIVDDPFTGDRTIWINTLNGNGHVTDEEWAEGFRNLELFAKIQNCKKICCQTRTDTLANLAERRGMVSTWKYFEKEV